MIKNNKYIKYILDDFSELNGCYIGRGWHRQDCLSTILLFCTQWTFDLILSLRDISRLGIHPYRFYYTYINIISMDASFYLMLPARAKISLFCLNGQPTICTTEILYFFSSQNVNENDQEMIQSHTADQPWKRHRTLTATK